MFSPTLFRYSKPSSFLVLLFLFFSSFHHFPCTLSQEDPALCKASFSCGNITAGFPFWGDDRQELCGHPSLGLRCDRSSNMTFLIISDLMYRVLEINTTFNTTLRLARQDLLGNFCSASLSSATLTPQLFETLPDYKTLSVHYLCNPYLHYHSNFTCLQTGIGFMDQNDVNLTHCPGNFNINVPLSYIPEEAALDLEHLQSVLKQGFKVKLKIDESPCHDCQSTGGFCNFRNNATEFCCKTNSSSEETNCLPVFTSQSSGVLGGGRTSAKASLTLKGKLGIGIACGILAGLIICKVLSLGHTKRETSHHDLKALLPLKHYSYAEVKKITESFTYIIGKGGFGTVYKGILFDGRKVAVKILKDSNSNGEDFINEVASISQTSHVNIVSLLGFCYEGCNRAIVYEFLENGSLDQFISNKNSLNLEMNTLYGIALGVARGLEYLHYGCKTRIVHFDIKPQNVLLDNNLCPKVSDFGLAKLCEKRESVLSLLDTRGTIGYIAPEVFSRMYGVISHKSDVYSYGMLILEMIGARNREIEENDVSNASSTYFPDWIFKNVENGEYKGSLGDEIREEEEDIGMKMILVGLWCIQPRPSDRPSMNRVVEMLEGSLDTLEVPPKPVLQFQEAFLSESSRPSKGSSVRSEV